MKTLVVLLLVLVIPRPDRISVAKQSKLVRITVFGKQDARILKKVMKPDGTWKLVPATQEDLP